MTQNNNSPKISQLQEGLFELLRQAAWVHENPGQNPQGTRWTGAIMGCHAIAQFIHNSGLSPALAAPFLEIMEGFKDLERGIVPPIFSLNPDTSKRNRSSRRDFVQSWAAAILELDIEEGKGEKESAERIAQSACKWTDFKNQNVTRSTIMNCRKQIKSGSREERGGFESICNALRNDPYREKRIKEVLANGPPGLSKS